MNVKRYIGASITVFVSFQVLDFIIHGIILAPTYEALKDVWRQDMMSKMWIMYITSLVLSFLFAYVFTKGYEGKGIAEGIRYGIIIGLLMNVVGMFNQYVVYPIPFSLALKWFIFGTIEFVACGIVASLIYKPKTTS
jgi:tryptophan-rich sensory protein